jgi:hypothetical protein
VHPSSAKKAISADVCKHWSSAFVEDTSLALVAAVIVPLKSVSVDDFALFVFADPPPFLQNKHQQTTQHRTAIDFDLYFSKGEVLALL